MPRLNQTENRVFSNLFKLILFSGQTYTMYKCLGSRFHPLLLLPLFATTVSGYRLYKLMNQQAEPVDNRSIMRFISTV